MLSERDVELAHPQAFDFVFGNLPPGDVAEFNEHLEGCQYCQGVVAEYGEIGRIVQELPPHVEPPATLEDRTVAAMMRTLAEQNAEADQKAPSAATPPSQGSDRGRRFLRGGQCPARSGCGLLRRPPPS